MIENNNKITEALVRVLSPKSGVFGRIYTWGMRPTQYEFVGYELSEDFMPTVKIMSENQRENLVRIINYFEIHAFPLKRLLEKGPDDQFYNFYADIAWSHFMTVVMFGMLEVAVKITDSVIYKGKYIKKYESIESFLMTYVPKSVQDDISKRYKMEKMDIAKSLAFSDVIGDLWREIRSGFVHEAGIESKGLEWHKIGGQGTQNDPITFKSDVPMQELLQMTWQAILSSYGYKGEIRLPKYKKF